MTIVFQFQDGQWQILLGGTVLLVAKTPGQGAASAASLHVVLLRDGLVSASQRVELGPGATEEHLRLGYVAVKREDLFEARQATHAQTA